MTDTALYFTAPETVEVRETAVGPPAADELLVDTRASAISAGTELLVYRDQTPADLPADETLDALDGDLSYPLRYGYAASGVVREVGSDVDPNWVGRSVFSFVPHQTSFCATPDSVVALPPETTPAAGSLLPSVETATNIVLDAAPRLGERVVVFGAGVIGLCVTRLLAAFPLESLVVVDPIERRRALAAEFGADRTTTPTELGDADPAGADLAVDGADPRSSCPASRARWTMRSGSSATTRGSSSARGTGPNASRSIWAGDSTGTASTSSPVRCRRSARNCAAAGTATGAWTRRSIGSTGSPPTS